MAAIFPVDKTQPWTFNNVTYEYDINSGSWAVVSTTATDQVVDSLEDLGTEIEDINDQIDEELETRDALIAANTGKNAAQDAAIAELDARVDSISENIGILEFKGVYTYVTQATEASGNAAFAACSAAPGADASQCLRDLDACKLLIDAPLADGTFTSVDTNVLKDVEELIITNTDINGDSLDWENVLSIGDYLELAEPNTIDGGVTGGDTVLYEVIADPTRSGGQEDIRVRYIKETGNGDGLFDLQTNYTIRVFKKDLGIDINEADARYLQLAGGKMTGDITLSGGLDSNLLLLNEGFIRFGTAGGEAEQYGGYIQMSDDDNLAIGTYSNKNLKFAAATASFDGKVSMSDTLSFEGATSTTKDYVLFKNERKANQTSVIKIYRPYSVDSGSGSGADGTGGLNIRLMSNSPSNTLKLTGGSGGTADIITFNGGSNDKQIEVYKSIQLKGATDAKQTIWTKNGTTGHLSYADITDDARRISWGDSKVWIRNANLDMTMNEIYNVSVFKQVHDGNEGKKFSITGESTTGEGKDDFFYSYKNPSGTLDAINYNGKMDNNSNIVNKKYVDDAIGGAGLDGFVKKSGDTMVGNLTFELAGTGMYFSDGTNNFADIRRLDGSTTVLRAENSKAFKIQARDANNNSRTYMDVQTKDSSGTGGSDSGYRCKIYHLADPTSDLHATNQRYVKAEDAKRVEGKFKITSAGGNYYIQPN